MEFHASKVMGTIIPRKLIDCIRKPTSMRPANDRFVGGKLASNCAKVELYLAPVFGVLHKGAER